MRKRIAVGLSLLVIAVAVFAFMRTTEKPLATDEQPAYVFRDRVVDVVLHANVVWMDGNNQVKNCCLIRGNSEALILMMGDEADDAPDDYPEMSFSNQVRKNKTRALVLGSEEFSKSRRVAMGIKRMKKAGFRVLEIEALSKPIQLTWEAKCAVVNCLIESFSKPGPTDEEEYARLGCEPFSDVENADYRARYSNAVGWDRSPYGGGKIDHFDGNSKSPFLRFDTSNPQSTTVGATVSLHNYTGESIPEIMAGESRDSYFANYSKKMEQFILSNPVGGIPAASVWRRANGEEVICNSVSPWPEKTTNWDDEVPRGKVMEFVRTVY